MNIASKTSLFLVALLLIVTSESLFSQTTQKQKMHELNFMIGEWVGTSKSFKNGKKVSSVPAYQEIKYLLDSHLIVINLHSSTLQLHTVIRYDEKDSTYSYQAFSKRGTGELPASIIDGKLVVQSNATTRYIFGKHGDSGFREYGEKLMDGKWIRYFEDTFENTN